MNNVVHSHKVYNSLTILKARHPFTQREHFQGDLKSPASIKYVKVLDFIFLIVTRFMYQMS
jgi:hypothetical protein